MHIAHCPIFCGFKDTASSFIHLISSDTEGEVMVENDISICAHM